MRKLGHRCEVWQRDPQGRVWVKCPDCGRIVLAVDAWLVPLRAAPVAGQSLGLMPHAGCKRTSAQLHVRARSGYLGKTREKDELRGPHTVLTSGEHAICPRCGEVAPLMVRRIAVVASWIERMSNGQLEAAQGLDLQGLAAEPGWHLGDHDDVHGDSCWFAGARVRVVVGVDVPGLPLAHPKLARLVGAVHQLETRLGEDAPPLEVMGAPQAISAELRRAQSEWASRRQHRAHEILREVLRL